MKVIGTMRALDETRGAVRVQDAYDTDIDDLWDACTKPDRLARWIATVTGDLSLGGDFEAQFSDGWEGAGRIEACEPPRRLLVTTREAGQSHATAIEVTLTPEGGRTLLVIEERGLPLDQIAAYGAGWQIHAEHLADHISGGELCDIKARWNDLIPHYREMTVEASSSSRNLPNSTS